MASHHEKIEQLTNRLDEWDYKINLLENRVKDLPDEIRAAAEKKYQKLKDYQATLVEKELALKNATEHAIHDIEHSFEEVWDTFKLLFDKVELDVVVEGL